MRLLYSGGSDCDSPTLKRLLLIAEEIGFMDRPSITFGRWGTIGHESSFRRVRSKSEEVSLSVHSPPSGPVNDLYKGYIEADLKNLDFQRIFLEGLANNEIFALKFLPPTAKYSTRERDGTVTGAEVRSALVKDRALLSAVLDNEVKTDYWYRIHDPVGRNETLKILEIEASIQLTNAMIVSEKTGLIPITNDPYLAKLLSMRSCHSFYVGGTSRLAPFLGIEITKAVIPDKALQQLSVADILGYRKTK